MWVRQWTVGCLLGREFVDCLNVCKLMKSGLCPVKQLYDCQRWHFLAVAVRMLIGLSLGALFHRSTSFYVIPSSFVMSWRSTCLRLIPNRMCSVACLRIRCVRISSKRQSSPLPRSQRRTFRPQDVINQWLVHNAGLQVQVVSNFKGFPKSAKQKERKKAAIFSLLCFEAPSTN
jgi:hypothetical protein